MASEEQFGQRASSGGLLALKRNVINDVATTLPEIVTDNPSFLHALLCQLGLPRRKTEARHFERRSGQAALLLEAGRSNNGLRFVEEPLPTGTRPRLVLIHICSEAVRTKQKVIEIGESTRDFLRKLRISEQGSSMKAFRDQMRALACCHMTLGFVKDGRVGQVDTKPIKRFEAWLVDELSQRALWPAELELSGEFMETLREHAVPLAPDAVAKLQHSALSLDAYTWLAHRLCRVRQDQGVGLSWEALRNQFGQEYKGKRGINDFQKDFMPALRNALAAYPEARVEKIQGGIKLLPSPPPVKRSKVVALLPRVEAKPDAAPVSPSAHEYKLLDGRVEWAAAWDRAQELRVSHDCMETVGDIAPGWDRNALMNKYYYFLAGKRAPLARTPDRAYRGWVKKFTKGQGPG